MRFVHTGDWQLGMTRRYLSDEAQARFSAARVEVTRTIGALAADRGCAFVVCAGDVFEHNALDRRVVARALEAMGECPVPVYLLPGNHDPLDAASVYRSATFVARRPANVEVLDGTRVVEPTAGVELLGAPWGTKRPLDDLVAGACRELAPLPEGVRILVAHGAIDAGAPDPDDPALIDLDALEQRIAAGCLHYAALGDRHSCTQVGATGRVWYAGSPEPTDFDEVDPGRALVVDVGPDHCEVEAVRVGTWRFVQRRVDLDGDDDVDALAGWLEEQPDKDRTVVRLTVVGTLPLRVAAELDAVVESAGDLYAALDVWEPGSDLVVLPDDLDFSDLGLAGFADRTVVELRALAGGPGREAAQARDALALLYRLAGTGASAAGARL